MSATIAPHLIRAELVHSQIHLSLSEQELASPRSAAPPPAPSTSAATHDFWSLINWVLDVGATQRNAAQTCELYRYCLLSVGTIRVDIREAPLSQGNFNCAEILLRTKKVVFTAL